MAKTTFDTSEFENSHGTSPRGRGAWHFVAVDPNHETFETHAVGTFTQARQRVRHLFPHVKEWQVCP